MSNLDEILTDCKRTISKWEHEFQKANGQRPSKEAFKAAPSEVTEAYKVYYKIKKKKELSKLGEISPDGESRSSPPNKEVPQQSPSDTPKIENNIWGAHLNKSKQAPETPKTPVSSSPCLSYSKLTEKLMKGAKINIRSSLSRRLSSNKISNSPKVASTQPGTPNESCLIEDSNSSFMTNTPPEAFASFLNVPEDSSATEEPRKDLDVIERLKPKIVQKKTVSRAYSVQNAASNGKILKAPSRTVDLGWLDDCLAVDKATPSKQIDDEDVIYSSEDEGPKSKRKSIIKPPKVHSPMKSNSDAYETEQTELVATKRKLEDEEEENVAPNTKKNKIENFNDEIGIPKQPPTEDCYEFDEKPSTSNRKGTASVENPTIAAKRERLANKIASGTINQNFVRINLKKKVFVRGKKGMTGSMYKRQQWKQRQTAAGGGGNYKANMLTCRRCGEVGHWAKNCMSDKLLSMENLKEQGDSDELEFPTLEEAMEQADDVVSKRTKKTKQKEEGERGDEGDLQLVELPKVTQVEPLCAEGDGPPPALMQTLKKFGHSSFRPGQQETIMRILSGRSTLVVQSTGAGKSLCYQLPAVMYAQRSPAVTIVVSPLVSLMEDQVANLPSFVKGVCLHSGQSNGQRQKTLQALQSGSVHILLISPESVTSSGPYGLMTLLRTCLPPVAFVCIDEAHCVSQWSHNFRPSYLRICKILRKKMNIGTILGLTATAPKSTLKSIADNLGVDSETGVVRGVLLPNNLQLSVSRDADRDAALLELLQGGRFADYNSIIIYCIRREECERLATLLRTYLKDPVKDLECKGAARRRGISWSAEAYHAGMTSARRISVQKQFMSGKLKIVVATVAFGMGINKSDIRGIIHYNAPKNFENYVQEIGRAGRDGLPAHCHVFLNSEGRDLQELRRFIYANSTDRHILRKLVRKILPEPCQCTSNGLDQCKGHEVALPVESTVQELDMPEENIDTLLCHLEAHPSRWVLEVGSKVYATCTVRCYGGLQQLKTAARDCAPLGAALAMQKSDSTAVRTFAVVDVARKIGWESGQVKRALKQLEWDSSAVAAGGKYRRSGIMIEFSDLAFHLTMRGDLTEEEQDAALVFLHQRAVNREAGELQQLQRIHQALLSISHSQATACSDEVDSAKSDKLRSFIQDYFEESGGTPTPEVPVLCAEKDESHIRSDIRSLVLSYRDTPFTARSIARIFHGISSPCFPAEIWGKARKHWRAHLHQDFNMLVRMAAQELLALK